MTADDDPTRTDFPIVGIGASAGGLDACKALLTSIPADTGAAFIVIQHLDPEHDSMMGDLLSRETDMRVMQAENAAALAPNTVYVIPPGKFIRLDDHGLFLDEPVKRHGIRMPIDYFFRSLAEARGEHSIALVLSGTGSDGTLGVREVKAAGGMVMVQTPEDAEFDGMPRSAIDTGAVDFVVPVADMGDTLVKFLRHSYLRREQPKTGLAEEAPAGFDEVLDMLRRHTDYDFSSYKKTTVERRIQRRISLLQFGELSDYVAHLRETPDEVDQLFRDLLIGVTRFFREPEAWQTFATEIVDSLIAGKEEGGTIRAWVPGCASGEEAYTLAMMLYDRIGRQNVRVSVQIFATDLNDRAIEIARNGRYSPAAAEDIPDEMLERYFTDEGDAIRVNKELRETVVFASQNVISDPPFSNLDLITCRNLMIYLEPEVQKRLLDIFHFALTDEGHLFLGNSENAEKPGRLFVAVDKRHRIYRKNATARVRPRSFPIVHGDKRRRDTSDPAAATSFKTGVEEARRHLMDRFVPASLLVDRSLEVQYMHGPVRNYLDFPEGEPTRQLPEMALPALRTRLRGVLNKVLADSRRAETEVKDVPRNGHRMTVRIVAELLGSGEGGSGILVFFEDASEPRHAGDEDAVRAQARKVASPEERDQVSSLKYELDSTREDLHSTIAEMESANEKLKASNEEVMSMNEELQSTNEEMETSGEELQSLNEELSTVNGQLEDKIQEVERTNNDLTNLLLSTDIGVIFLDTDLVIRRFTPAMREIMRIIDGDVGRPIEDIAMRVQDLRLIEDARHCLDKLTEVEAELETTNGKSLIRRVRPYRTLENRIEGVVVTYTDVTSLQNARAAARQREEQQAAVAELGRTALTEATLDEVFELAIELIVERLDVRFAKILQLDPDKRALTLRTGHGWTKAVVGESKVHSGVSSQAGYTLERSSPVVVRDFREERRFTAPPILKDHHILCGASVIIGPIDDPWGVLGAHESDVGRCDFDADDVNFMQAIANVLWLVIYRDRSASKMERERHQLRALTDALPILFAIVDTDGRYEFVNRAFEALGRKKSEIEGRRVVDAVSPEDFAKVAPHIEKALAGEPQDFEVEVKPFDAEQSAWFLASYVPRKENGAITGFYAASIDITEKKELERDLRERFEQYRALGDSIDYGVWITDPDGRLRYISRSYLDLTGRSFDEVKNYGWVKTLDPAIRQETAELWEETRKSGGNWEKELRVIGADGDTYHILALGRPIRNEAGEVTSWAGLNIDITERKEEEERLTVLTAELDHRVKNILATVNAIARMSAKEAGSVEQYRKTLEDRFHAMAAAHKLLADAKWQDMDIGDIVKTELAPYMARHGDAIRLEGQTRRLPRELVQSFALAIHELTTNSVKYGALANEGGKLTVTWGHDPDVMLEWNETGLTGVERPRRQGFGTNLLTKILPAQNVDVTLRYLETGLHATMKRRIAGQP